jgi:tripartite-type tricarboxylate transporter receptor subunit TctC
MEALRMKARKSKFRVSAEAAACVWFGYLLLQPGWVFSQVPFYQGKTITVISGQEPGGTADMRLKALLPYLKKHIPGQPNLVPEYMPGGGGRKAGNYIYRTARPDGLTLGFPPGGFIMFAVLGETGVDYDLDKFTFFGTPESDDHYVFLTRRETHLNSIEKLQNASGVRVGGHSVGHIIYTLGRVFAYLLRLREPKFITGFSGPELDQAVMRGEVDARVNRVATILQRNPEWVEKKMADFQAIIQIPKGAKHPRFSHLPEIESFAKSDKERRLLDINRAFRITGATFITPPGAPKERVQILREAITKVFRDPEFAKDYKKIVGEEPSPLMPDEFDAVIRKLPRDREDVELFKKSPAPVRYPSIEIVGPWEYPVPSFGFRVSRFECRNFKLGTRNSSLPRPEARSAIVLR